MLAKARRRKNDLEDIATPAAVVDRGRLERNCERISELARRNDLNLRPHLKTAKSAKIAEIATRHHSGAITVSTITEAEYFCSAGFKDITYAVGLVPGKIAAIAKVQKGGCQVNAILDNASIVPTIDRYAVESDTRLRILIEVDSGGHRGGVLPGSGDLIDIARALQDSQNLTLFGVLTHGGHSYGGATAAGIAKIAEEERAAAVVASTRLRTAGFECATVSAGSTPSVSYAKSFEGVNEIRAGVYMFGDIQQVTLGTCSAEDIAFSVLATVIGHNTSCSRILVDAGSLALSKDLLRNADPASHSYGRVADIRGNLLPCLFVDALYQEHGLIASEDNAPPYDALPIGSKVRIMPNHACLAAAGFDTYAVVDGGTQIVDSWGKARGW